MPFHGQPQGASTIEGGAASERAARGEAACAAGLDCGGAPWPTTRRRCAAARRWAWQVWRPLQAVVVHLASHQGAILLCSWLHVDMSVMLQQMSGAAELCQRQLCSKNILP